MRRLFSLPALMVVCMGVDLPANGPVPVENPHPRSSVENGVPVPALKPAADASKRNRKNDAADKQATEQPEPSSSKPETGNTEKPASLPGITAPKADETALAHCEAELRKLGAVFSREDPVNGENGCGIEAPYSITQIVRGVALSPASQMRCATALALARWTDTVLIPATAALPEDAGLSQINHGSTYVCRRRNNLPTGKMSEHSIGNAIDIVDFEFDGRQPIGISPRQGDGDIEEAFQRALRGGACLHFTTVLGPGSDTSHAGHLHLDIAERRGGYRLCQ